jgi:hypothetical protein
MRCDDAPVRALWNDASETERHCALYASGRGEVEESVPESRLVEERPLPARRCRLANFNVLTVRTLAVQIRC